MVTKQVRLNGVDIEDDSVIGILKDPSAIISYPAPYEGIVSMTSSSIEKIEAIVKSLQEAGHPEAAIIE
jgi:hypothetical protein